MARYLELVNITNELRSWLTGQEHEDEYNATYWWEAVATELHEYQELRKDFTHTRIENYKAAEHIRNQSATPPDTIHAYVEARALLRRAEKEKAANDAVIDDFIARAAFRPEPPQQQHNGGPQTPPPGTVGPPRTSPTGNPGSIHDTLFAQMKVEDGYAVIKEHPEMIYVPFQAPEGCDP